MNLKPRRHEEPEINMVSLIDVVLDRPMELALADVHLSSEVRSALMGRACKASLIVKSNRNNL